MTIFTVLVALTQYMHARYIQWYYRFINVYIAKSVSFVKNAISLLKKMISSLTTIFLYKTKFISKFKN